MSSCRIAFSKFHCTVFRALIERENKATFPVSDAQMFERIFGCLFWRNPASTPVISEGELAWVCAEDGRIRLIRMGRGASAGTIAICGPIPEPFHSVDHIVGYENTACYRLNHFTDLKMKLLKKDRNVCGLFRRLLAALAPEGQHRGIGWRFDLDLNPHFCALPETDGAFSFLPFPEIYSPYK